MRTLFKIFIGIAVIVLAIFAFIYITAERPGMGPLKFSIYNRDNVTHAVTVEIFDSNNNSLFEESYDALSKVYIQSPEITKKKGEYIFKVTLDNKIEETYTATVGTGWFDVAIYLYENDSGNKPIYITQAVI